MVAVLYNQRSKRALGKVGRTTIAEQPEALKYSNTVSIQRQKHYLEFNTDVTHIYNYSYLDFGRLDLLLH